MAKLSFSKYPCQLFVEVVLWNWIPAAPPAVDSNSNWSGDDRPELFFAWIWVVALKETSPFRNEPEPSSPSKVAPLAKLADPLAFSVVLPIATLPPLVMVRK